MAIRHHDTTGQTRPEMTTLELIGLLSAQAERDKEERFAALIQAHTGFLVLLRAAS